MQLDEAEAYMAEFKSEWITMETERRSKEYEAKKFLLATNCEEQKLKLCETSDRAIEALNQQYGKRKDGILLFYKTRIDAWNRIRNDAERGILDDRD
ncbi:MAG: hypothetical protein HC921_21015 [Synechococcaceae cyanobacterium SM2_3_1]|nr:hypothetical protein [Synechococcaceae cyanobacterium SM2_3_1]